MKGTGLLPKRFPVEQRGKEPGVGDGRKMQFHEIRTEIKGGGKSKKERWA